MSITNVKKLSELASTALATYAYFDVNSYEVGLTASGEAHGVGMTPVQKNAFMARYLLVDQHANDITGFAATLFTDRLDSNKKVLALRGTEFTEGLDQILTDAAIADALGIAGAGFANFQAIQLYRYVKELTTVGGEAVQYSDDDIAKIAMMFFAKQIELATVILPQGTAHDIAVWASQQAGFSSLFTDLANDKGIGTGAALIQPGEKVDVTGHSLGGHLALLFARMFPQYTDQVVTLNAPTFFAIGDTFLTSIGFPPGSGSNITRLEAEGDAVHLFGNVDPGYAISIAQEEFPDAINKVVGNHSSVNGVDGLNLMALIVKLDPSLINSLMQISGFIRNASNDFKDTYEKTLDALRNMILGNSITDTIISSGSSDANRKSFYDNMDDLQNSATFQSLVGNVTLAAPASSASEARSDFGAFLSLYYLTPFALKITDAAAESSLAAVQGTLYDQWNDDGALTSEQIANGEANFSDMYLADRVAMLSWVVKINKEDFVDNNTGLGYVSNSPSQYFEDKSTSEIININKFSSDQRKFIFGNDDNTDTLTGADKADHLYGMGGDDTLNGGKGSDRLEGGADADTLNGEDDADILLGGTGDDKLTGGKGADFLKGGEGTDTYIHAKGDGNDVIIDSDGEGKIQHDGQTLTGGKQVKGTTNLWQSADEKTRYALYHNGDGIDTLNIFLSNGERIFVKDWHTDNLGIKLEDNEASQPTVKTDDSDYYKPNTADEVIDGSAGNDVLVGGDQTVVTLIGGAGNDLILGAGNDLTNGYISNASPEDWKEFNASWQIDHTESPDDVVYYLDSAYLTTHWKITGADPDTGDEYNSEAIIYAGANASPQGSTLLGGTGDDVIGGTGATDYIDGGDDNDILYGNAGDDNIFGSQGKDYVFGGDGNDNIDGGTEDDELIGGYGADYLMGGAGNDELVADLLPLHGTDTPPQSTDYSQMGGDILDSGMGNDYLYGGAGDNTLLGGKGDDELSGDMLGTPQQYQGGDYLDGGEGNDKLWGNGGDDTLLGSDGDDLIEGDYSVAKLAGQYHGKDLIDGGGGADTILGGGGDDIIFGGAGDDLITGDGDEVSGQYEGNDIIDGGTGNDSVVGAGGNDTLLGGAGKDQLFGESGNDLLDGGADDDVLKGGDGDDTLEGGSGHDSLFGDAGSDTLISTGDGDYLAGGAGQDTYYAQVGDFIEDVDQDANTIKFGSANQSGSGNATNITMEQVSIITINPNTQATQVKQAIAINDGTGTRYILNGSTSNAQSVFEIDGTQIAYTTLVGDTLQTQLNMSAVNGTAIGGVKDDTLNAQYGINTYLSGGRGNDILNGNTGNDTIMGGEGEDQIIGDAGDDAIDGGQGADNLFGEAGSDTINGGDGNDQLIGDGATTEGAADLLNGGNGADTLWGQAGNDTLNGEADNDVLLGGDGNDILSGGTGADQLHGDAGNDTYLLNLGDGHDYIQDTDGTHKIIFGAGITLQNITVTFPNPASSATANSKNLVIHYGESNSVTVSALSINAMTFQFSNGQTLSYTNLKTAFPNPIYTAPNSVIYGSQHNDYLNTPSTGGVIHAGSENDYLIGDNSNDQLYGDGGSDTLNGNNGNDTLEGGLGNDALNGGNGSDTYVFKRGDGQDTLSDYPANETEINTLQFGADITANDVSYIHAASGALVIRINNSNDSITINNWYNSPANQLQVIKYGDGSQQDLTVVNSLDIADIVATQNGSTLNGDDYNNRLVGGAGNDTLIGGLGSDTLIGGAGVDTYVLGWTRGEAVGYDPVVDPDTVIESTDNNIIALPLGLDFNGIEIQKRGNDLYIGVQGSRNVDYFHLQENSNNVYSDFPPDGMLIKDYYSGSQGWQVKMTDGSVRTMADLIQEVNQAPTDLVQSAYNKWVVGQRQIALTDAFLVANHYSGKQIDSNHFEWIEDDRHRTLGIDFTETYSDEATIYRISDYEHYQYEETGSYSKVISGSQYSQTISTGAYAIPIFDYGQVDAAGSPKFVGFLEGGGSSNDDSGSYTVTVTATKEYSAWVLDKLQAGASDNVIDVRYSGVMAVFAGAGNDIIRAYGWSGYGPIGNFFNGEEGNDSIFGTYHDDVIIAGTGNDFLSGNDGDDTYLINISETGIKLIDEVFEDIVASGVGYMGMGGSRYSTDTIEFSSGLSVNDIRVSRGSINPELDIPGFVIDTGKTYDTLEITWGDATQTLRVVLPDPVNDPYNYNGYYGVEFYKFADGTILTAVQMEALAVTTPANHAPIINSAIADITTFEDATFSFTVPTDSFTDADSDDVLAYSVSLTDGSVLPAWLNFDATTQTFSGTPNNDSVDSLSLMLTATDLAGASVNQVFNLAVQNTNDAPIVVNAIAAQAALEDSTFTFVVPANTFADVDTGDMLSYTATLVDGTALPSWITFDAVTRTFSGTPLNANIGNLQVKLIATDIAGVAISQTFDLNVTNINDAPTIIGNIADVDVIDGNALSMTLPVATLFEDTDVGDQLTYSVTLADGSALPAWLSFDPTTLLISGTPNGADIGSLSLQVTATDIAGTIANINFNLSVSAMADQVLTGTTANNVLTGGSGNDTLNGLAGTDTMTGGYGNDSYYVERSTDKVIEEVNQGTDTINTTVTYTLAANVENLVLLGTSSIAANGNELDNQLTGNTGSNTLDGKAGADQMTGGLGNDTYIVDDVSDVVTELENEGIDTIKSEVSYTLGDHQERLTLTGVEAINGTGNDLNNIMIGNDAANQLIGNEGNDNLNGGLGADTMIGGLGNDIYVVENTLDTIVEQAGEGTDAVQSSITYTLSAEVENLTLTGTATINGEGNELNNTITGNAADNQLIGHAGNDNLNGGLGADILIGGLGNDIYTVDNANDVVIEQAGEGTDRVNSNISYVLGDDLENLTLTGTDATMGTGNDLANTITGNAADNQLIGNAGNDNLNGGLGADTMIGGLDNDTYTVDNVGDAVIEQLDEGIDRVNSAIDYVLGSNLENLTLTGITAINGSGNELNNTITGNAADNLLNGNDGNDNLNGGLGADTMIGGLGNDIFTVDNVGDVVIEHLDEGVDRVNSSISYTLGDDLENLTLTGSADINGLGNGLANILTGNTGHNYLFGLVGNDTITGNAGNDVLQGGEGADTLSSHAGNDVLDGGAGADRLNGGTDNDLFIGGLDNDIITTGTGYDVIAFNKGDGQDIISASTGADNTLSLGGNFAYSDLSLTKTGNNLILKVGSSDQITLQNWYASGGINKSVVNLQVIAESIEGFSLGSTDDLRNNKIENFNFAGLVSQFDAAGATANWQLTDARLTAHLQAGSDSAAIGGNLAYQYGNDSSLTGMGLGYAQSIIASASFGQTAQTLNNPSVWQAEVLKLG
ncbi:MAG: hypothetical protein CTY33_05680 [Methylotenera sp.]|nr:MAG: hypothetical protein CTY33_05680 [Methylotenera sp.]